MQDENILLNMLEHRNLTTLTYDEALAIEIFEAIRHSYLPMLRSLVNSLETAP